MSLTKTREGSAFYLIQSLPVQAVGLVTSEADLPNIVAYLTEHSEAAGQQMEPTPERP